MVTVAKPAFTAAGRSFPIYQDITGRPLKYAERDKQDSPKNTGAKNKGARKLFPLRPPPAS